MGLALHPLLFSTYGGLIWVLIILFIKSCTTFRNYYRCKKLKVRSKSQFESKDDLSCDQSESETLNIFRPCLRSWTCPKTTQHRLCTICTICTIKKRKREKVKKRKREKVKKRKG